MLTIEQVLENNSVNEGVSIVVANIEQYNNLMTLLHNQGYRWKSGQSLTASPFDLVEECLRIRKGNKSFAIVVFFNSITKQVCQGDIKDEVTRTSLFITNANYILKPYILFDRELKDNALEKE